MWVWAQDVHASHRDRWCFVVGILNGSFGSVVCFRRVLVNRDPRQCSIAAPLRSTMRLASAIARVVVFLMEGHCQCLAPDGHPWSLFVMVSARKLRPLLELGG